MEWYYNRGDFPRFLGSPITYGAYGSGENPVIYGSEVIGGWTRHSGNIYKASVSKNVSQVFVDNAMMMAARYPKIRNTLPSTVNSQSQFSCSSLNSGINYKGANIISRSLQVQVQWSNCFFIIGININFVR